MFKRPQISQITQIISASIKPQTVDLTDYYGSVKICEIHDNPNHAQTMRSQNL